MANNIFQQRITPIRPKILSEERVFVYTPLATEDTEGIASFNDRDFIVNNGNVSQSWPMELEITELTDPINGLSRIHVSEDEFVPSNESITITNKKGQSFSTDKGSVKLNRLERLAFKRPDLVMLNSNEFVQETTTEGYHRYSFNLSKNHYNEKTFVQLDSQDFYDNINGNGVVKVNWPKAHDKSGTRNTDGYGLVKIEDNSAGYLKYSQAGLLQVDYSALVNSDGLQVIPTYGGTETTGFTDKRNYVDATGKAIRDSKGQIKLAITKDAVGLTKVANKAFSEYIYSDFGTSMKQHFADEFAKKLDTSVWNKLFSDWNAPSNDLRTPQLRFDYLTQRDEAQQDQIDTLFKAKLFLGYFMNEEALNAAYPPKDGAVWFGCYAFLYSTNTYWVIDGTSEENYKWVDTGFKILSYMDHIEDDVKALKPDGVASIGTTGKWIQSDHVHPTDETRLSKESYKATHVNVRSELRENLGDNAPANDFLISFWNEDENGNYEPLSTVNIPYVRKSKTIHNWQRSSGAFVDDEESEEKYWAGTAEQFRQEFDNQGLNNFKNNSIIFVDDGESSTVESFVTEEELRLAGITIDVYDQSDKIVIIDSKQEYADTLGTGLLTIDKTTQLNTTKYKLKPKSIGQYTAKENCGQLLLRTKNAIGNDDIAYKTFDPSEYSKLIKVGANNNITVSTIDDRNLLATSYGNNVITLDSNKLLQSGPENTVTTFDTGTVVNRVLVSNGENGIKTHPALSDNRVAITKPNGVFGASTYTQDNVLVSSQSSSKVLLDHGILAVAHGTNSNTITSLTMNAAENTPIVTNDTGEIKPLNLGDNSKGKLLLLNSNGAMSFLSMSSAQAGHVVGVSATGLPELMTVSVPTTLPATYTTVKPTTDNPNGLIIVKSSVGAIAENELKEGYLYLW